MSSFFRKYLKVVSLSIPCYMSKPSPSQHNNPKVVVLPPIVSGRETPKEYSMKRKLDTKMTRHSATHHSRSSSSSTTMATTPVDENGLDASNSSNTSNSKRNTAASSTMDSDNSSSKDYFDVRPPVARIHGEPKKGSNNNNSSSHTTTTSRKKNSRRSRRARPCCCSWLGILTFLMTLEGAAILFLGFRSHTILMDPFWQEDNAMDILIWFDTALGGGGSQQDHDELIELEAHLVQMTGKLSKQSAGIHGKLFLSAP